MSARPAAHQAGALIVDLRKHFPEELEKAKQALDALLPAIKREKTYEAIRKIIQKAEALKALYSDVEAIRQQAERVVVLASRKVGVELRKAPAATGTKGQGRPKIGGPRKGPPKTATLKEKVGSKNRGVNLGRLADIPEAKVEQTIKQLQAEGKEAHHERLPRRRHHAQFDYQPCGLHHRMG